MFWDVNTWVTTSSKQMKLNGINVEHNKIYSSKFESEIQRYLDFINDSTRFQNVHRLRHEWFSRSFFSAQKDFLYEPFVLCPNLYGTWCILGGFSHKCTLHSFNQLYSSILYHRKCSFFSNEWHFSTWKEKKH